MIYLYYLIGIVIITYGLIDFKKKSTDNAFTRYYNSQYYRLLIFVIGTIIALIISFFCNKNN
jgi:uncharacterized membrane protein